MLKVLDVVAPVFGVILLGYAVARFRLLPEGTVKGLSDFVFSIAMPALLFRTMATVESTGVSPVGLVTAYFGANLATWAMASLLSVRLLGRPATEAAAFSMGACFGNTVMLGLPLGHAYFGEPAAAAIAVIVALHAPILWIVATLQQEWSLHESHGSLAGKLGPLALDLARNPVVFGVVAGSLWRLTGLGLPGPADKLLALLGQAGIPGSLFALGMSLTRFEVRSELRDVGVVMALKLAVMPVLAWLIAQEVLGLAPIGVATVTLLAACPTGANAFLFASRYERAVGVVSGSVALGTAVAVVTISLLLLLLGGGGT